MRITWIAFLGMLTLAATTAPAAAATSPFEGRWDLTMDRPGWEPAQARASLTLARDGKTWRGTLTFSVLMNGTPLPVTDVVVKGSKIEFGLDAPGQEIAMKGALKKSALSGECKWGGKTWPWTAERAPDSGAIVRFEKGLLFDRNWKQGDAAKLGLDGDALDGLIRRAEEAKSDGLLVLKDGQVVCERYFGGSQEPVFAMSVTKFVAALAIAKLLDEKRIESVDAPLSTWFPSWNEGRRGKVTLRQVLTHTSGIAHEGDAGKLNREKKQVEYVLAHEVCEEPGTTYSYNNDAIALLTGVIRVAAGTPTEEYVKARIFEPLGIKTWWWKKDDAGDARTYADLSIPLRDLGKLGQLVAQNGAWGKQKIIEPSTIALFSASATELDPDQGLVWRIVRGRDGVVSVGVEHTGWLGQFLVVLPGQGLVGVRLRRLRDEKTDDDPTRNFGAFRSLLLRTVGE